MPDYRHPTVKNSGMIKVDSWDLLCIYIYQAKIFPQNHVRWLLFRWYNMYTRVNFATKVSEVASNRSQGEFWKKALIGISATQVVSKTELVKPKFLSSKWPRSQLTSNKTTTNVWKIVLSLTKIPFICEKWPSGYDYIVRLIAPTLLYWCYVTVWIWKQ